MTDSTDSMGLPSDNHLPSSNSFQKVGAIILAAGGSTRMGELDKVFVPLNGSPLISYSLDVLDSSPHINEIVLVMSANNLSQGCQLVESSGWAKVIDVCIGGERRQDSVRLGLERLSGCQWIVVHDGARPFIGPDLIENGLIAAQQTGAAIPGVPVKDTIKSAGPDMVVSKTIPREGLWAVQTPQFFSYQLLKQAHTEISDDVTDDASMVERIGGKVRLITGSYNNIKVTTPDDLPIAEAILKSLDLQPVQDNS